MDTNLTHAFHAYIARRLYLISHYEGRFRLFTQLTEHHIYMHVCGKPTQY